MTSVVTGSDQGYRVATPALMSNFSNAHSYTTIVYPTASPPAPLGAHIVEAPYCLPGPLTAARKARPPYHPLYTVTVPPIEQSSGGTTSLSTFKAGRDNYIFSHDQYPLSFAFHMLQRGLAHWVKPCKSPRLDLVGVIVEQVVVMVRSALLILPVHQPARRCAKRARPTWHLSREATVAIAPPKLTRCKPVSSPSCQHSAAVTQYRHPSAPYPAPAPSPPPPAARASPPPPPSTPSPSQSARH